MTFYSWPLTSQTEALMSGRHLINGGLWPKEGLDKELFLVFKTNSYSTSHHLIDGVSHRFILHIPIFGGREKVPWGILHSPMHSAMSHDLQIYNSNSSLAFYPLPLLLLLQPSSHSLSPLYYSGKEPYGADCPFEDSLSRLKEQPLLLFLAFWVQSREKKVKQSGGRVGRR